MWGLNSAHASPPHTKTHTHREILAQKQAKKKNQQQTNKKGKLNITNKL